MLNLILVNLIFNSFIATANQTDTLTLFHGPRNENKIALTFDACPSYTRGGFDTCIVRTLIDSCVPATFFLSGKWIKTHRKQVKRLASVPNFEFGNHSYSHPHCDSLSNDSILSELRKTDSLIKRITGISTNLFRPPYVEADDRIKRIVDSLGFKTVMYDLASADPDTTMSRERLIRRVVTRARNGSIIIMHINGRGWHTGEALPEIIGSLRKKGFVFVKVSEFLKKSGNKNNSKNKTQKVKT